MLKFKVIPQTLRVRNAPNMSARQVSVLKKGQEFFSDGQENGIASTRWARVLQDGAFIGWACVNDSLYRFLEEMAQPVPPSPVTPPTPEPPAESVLADRVTSLERRVALLENIAGIG